MRWTILAIAALLPANALHAQGLSVHSHSGCALARNSAGVAEPCADGSAVFYNPAALAWQPGAASAGVLGLYTKSEFTFDDTGESFDSEQGTKWAPHAWLTAQVVPGLAAGVGLWVPYGLATAWPLTFEGRFVGYDNSLRGVYIQPTLAGELIRDRLAVGLGMAFVRGEVEIRRRIDLATTLIPGTDVPFSQIGVPAGTDFADVHLDVDDWTATFNIGLQLRVSDRLSFGARYLHAADLDLTGTADFRQIPTGIELGPGNPLGLPAGTPLDGVLAPRFAAGGALSDQRLTSELKLPNQVVAGVSFAAAPDVLLLLEYQWTGWRHFDRAVLDFENAPTDTLFLEFRNTNTLRLAVDALASERLALRGGILYNDAATPDVSVTPLLIEGERVTFAGGLGYRITDRFSADAGFEVVLQEDRRGSVRPRTSSDQTAAELNVGNYSAKALVWGLTLSYRLGQLLHPKSADK